MRSLTQLSGWTVGLEKYTFLTPRMVVESSNDYGLPRIRILNTFSNTIEEHPGRDLGAQSINSDETTVLLSCRTFGEVEPFSDLQVYARAFLSDVIRRLV